MYHLSSIWNVPQQPERFLQAATAPPPFGPGFSERLAESADHIEVWRETFAADGDVRAVFQLFKAGRVIASRRVSGY